MPPVFPLSSLCGFQSIDLARMPFLCISLAEPNLFLIHQLKNHLQEIELITQGTHHFTSTFKFLEFLVRDMMSITESDRQMTLCVCVCAQAPSRESSVTPGCTPLSSPAQCASLTEAPQTRQSRCTVSPGCCPRSTATCHEVPWGLLETQHGRGGQ